MSKIDNIYRISAYTKKIYEFNLNYRYRTLEIIILLILHDNSFFVIFSVRNVFYLMKMPLDCILVLRKSNVVFYC